MKMSHFKHMINMIYVSSSLNQHESATRLFTTSRSQSHKLRRDQAVLFFFFYRMSFRSNGYLPPPNWMSGYPKNGAETSPIRSFGLLEVLNSCFGWFLVDCRSVHFFWFFVRINLEPEKNICSTLGLVKACRTLTISDLYMFHPTSPVGPAVPCIRSSNGCGEDITHSLNESKWDFITLRHRGAGVRFPSTLGRFQGVRLSFSHNRRSRQADRVCHLFVGWRVNQGQAGYMCKRYQKKT